ncbi:hypothetical protein RAS2_28300 [Phycisphaerae bacterium RAS2]|nr:hypothetical protein RAS2_28300 [Phycisphaerae bacterium RAS2]
MAGGDLFPCAEPGCGVASPERYCECGACKTVHYTGPMRQYGHWCKPDSGQ